MKHALIVDDDLATVSLVGEALRAVHWTFDTARNGVEGLTHIDGHTPDVVLLDLRMPEMDGWTFAVKYREKHPDVRVVLMTALPEAVTVGMEMNVSGVLAKPFNLADLYRAIGQSQDVQLTE